MIAPNSFATILWYFISPPDYKIEKRFSENWSKCTWDLIAFSRRYMINDLAEVAHAHIYLNMTEFYNFEAVLLVSKFSYVTSWRFELTHIYFSKFNLFKSKGKVHILRKWISRFFNFMPVCQNNDEYFTYFLGNLSLCPRSSS